MPYPQNLETAKRVEAAVQERGAVPATIALMHGKVCIGLDSVQLEQLAKQGLKCEKVSRRDILPVLAAGKFGATTVAATMVLADMAGIRVFVTGGIGGVHRGVEDSMDVSADLTELGRTPVAVVCAGVKSVRCHITRKASHSTSVSIYALCHVEDSTGNLEVTECVLKQDCVPGLQILDIPRTLEYLETQGVAVTSFQADEFPAFFTRSSGIRSPRRVDSIPECVSNMSAVSQKQNASCWLALTMNLLNYAQADSIMHTLWHTYTGTYASALHLSTENPCMF